MLGFALHTHADLHGPSPETIDNFVFGAPALAPMLFPNMALLCGLGLCVLRDHVLKSETSVPTSTTSGIR
jgi:hypothetical protein